MVVRFLRWYCNGLISRLGGTPLDVMDLMICWDFSVAFDDRK